MDIFFDNLGSYISLPGDQVKMLFGFFITIPLGFHFKTIKNNQHRFYYGLILGLIMSYLVYDYGLISVLIQNVIVYELTKRITLKGPITPRLVFIEVLVFVSLHHIYRQYTDYGGWKLDITTVLMINTVKWTSFAYCYYDGLRKEEELTSEQKERRLTQLPSYLDYFGYIFFFFGCLTGPAYDYFDYDQFLNQKGIYQSIPSTVKETIRLFRNGLIYSFLIAVVYPKIALDTLISEEFGATNFFIQSIWFNASITLLRTKYLAGWLFSEAGLAAAGFTYNGEENGQSKWLRLRNIDPSYDLDISPKDKIDKWNISIQLWLRRYVYLRIYPESELKSNPKKQQRAQLITFAVSAFWHGFYPSYYVAFMHWNFVNQINKFLFKLGQNTSVLKIWNSNPVMKFMKFYWVNTLFNYYGVAFNLLDLRKVLCFFNSQFWLYNVATYGIYAFFTLTGFGQKKKEKKQ